MNTAPDADNVVLSYLNAVDAGDAPDPADWLARYPQFADQLAPFFAVESRFGRVRPSNSTLVRHDTPAPDNPGDDSPETLGLGDRYEWGGVLGRGGMGSVVRVRDKTLDRRVAIKILRRRHRENPQLAERFRDEVRIAAGLQHPGVPPVHDVGTAPDGRPFMVMKLIEGSTLADLLARRPDPAHDLPGFLKVFEQVAQTVAYAHSKGVLHRDLKPHNVMVGAFGEVQVMDWGLAKMLASRDREGAGDPNPAPSRSRLAETADARPHSDRTRAGTAVGTPAYMAPEQARGEIDRADRRADVFGLGAVLCEILTGRPPFTGYDPLAQSRRADLTDAHQRLDRATCDRDLAALARRCLDADPANRPADGRAVADGITGYLAGVQERLRQTELAGAKAAAERRRRRAVRGFGALAAALLVVGLASVLAVQARANANLTGKNTELAAANDRERQRFALAVDAIGLFHGEASQDLLLKEDQFKPLRAKLLHGAADFYTRLEGQLAGRDDPESQTALAGAYTQLGKLHAALGDRPAAEAAWHKVLAIRRQLAAAPDADRETRLAVASTLMGMGGNQKEFDRTAAAATLGEAQSVAEAVERDRGGETFESRLLVAEIVFLRANLALGREQPDEATELCRQALAVLEPFRTTHPNDSQLLRRFGETHLQIAQGASDSASGRRHTRQALGYYRTLLDLNPLDVKSRRDVAHCHMALAQTSQSAEVPLEEVIADADAGRDLAAHLVREYPAVPEFRRVLALSSYYAGRYHLLSNRLTEARTAYEAARGHFRQLSETGDATHRRFFALTGMFLAGLDLEDGKPDAALQGCRQAEREMGELHRKDSSDLHQAMLAVIARRTGLVHRAAGRTDEAVAETRRASGLLAPVWKKLSYFNNLRIELAACHATLAGLAGELGSGVLAADAEPEAAEAMKLLNTNTADYYPHPNVLTRDRAFDSLRDRADFQEFIRKGETLVEKARKDAARVVR